MNATPLLSAALYVLPTGSTLFQSCSYEDTSKINQHGSEDLKLCLNILLLRNDRRQSRKLWRIVSEIKTFWAENYWGKKKMVILESLLLKQEVYEQKC